MVASHDDTPVLRPSARVLLIDDNGRTLLFASMDEAGRTFWYPAGGGANRERPPRRPPGEKCGKKLGCATYPSPPRSGGGEVWNRGAA